MIKRDIERTLRSSFRDVPAIVVAGNREAGKTTLVKSAFPQLQLVSFDVQTNIDKAQENPEKFIEMFPHGVIFDAIHKAPFMLPYIEKKINACERNSLFVLTARFSAEFQHLSNKYLSDNHQFFRVFSLSLTEVNNARRVEASQLDSILVQGFSPFMYSKPGQIPDEIYQQQLSYLLEQELKDSFKADSPEIIHTFLKICANNIGKFVNKVEAFKELSLTEAQVDQWLSVLENASLLFRVPPSPMSLGKHVKGTVKFFFYDVGFVVWLLNISTPQQLFAHTMREDLFENLVASESLKYRTNRGLPPNLYFYRDSRKNEIDLMLEYAEGFFPVITRSASTYETHFQSNLDLVQSHSFKGSAVILGGGRRQERKNVTIIPWHQYPLLLKEIEK